MYDYRVTEIELIISGSPTSNALNSSIKRVDYSTLPVAKLLENVENSYFNVSSTKSEQCELCINSPLYIDTRLLWKQTIGSNGP